MKLLSLRKKKMCPAGFRVKFLAFLFLNFIMIDVTNAQETSKKSKIYGGLGYFAVGFTQLNTGALNTRLQDEGFPAVPADHITFGGGGHAIIGNFIIGGEGHSLSSNSNFTEKSGKQVESRLDAGYGFFNVGYVAFAKKAVLIYPMIGMGGGGMSLKLSDAPQATSFHDILKDHRRSIVIDNGGFILNFQLAADFVLSGNEAGRGGMLIGLHGGYMYAPTKWNWSWSGTGISGGPDANLNGPYVRLTFGGGGYGKSGKTVNHKW